MSTRAVRVGLLDDRQSEGVEDFTLAIELVDKALGQPGVISQATVQILDDESKSGRFQVGQRGSLTWRLSWFVLYCHFPMDRLFFDLFIHNYIIFCTCYV